MSRAVHRYKVKVLHSFLGGRDNVIEMAGLGEFDAASLKVAVEKLADAMLVAAEPFFRESVGPLGVVAQETCYFASVEIGHRKEASNDKKSR